MLAEEASDGVLPAEGIVQLLENIKSTLVESFEKLDQEIKECKKDIRDVKEKVQQRELVASSRLSVISGARSPLPSPRILIRDTIRMIGEREKGLKFQSVGQMLPCINAFKQSLRKKNNTATEADLLEVLKHAIEDKDVNLTINCFEEGCDINDEVKHNDCVAFGKPWIQFILETWTDEDTVYLMEQIGKEIVNMDRKNQNKKNLLHIATERDLPTTVKILLELAKSQDLLNDLTEASDFVGYIPVHYAALRLSERSLVAFIKFETDVTRINPQTGETVLTIIGNRVEQLPQEQSKYQSIFRLFVRHNLLNSRFINLRPMNHKSNSPLHYSVAFGTKQDVQKLVELGAFPERNSDGKSPFFIAAEKGKGNVLKYLLDKFSSGKITVDIDLPDTKGDTCLHAAIRRCKTQASAVNMIEMLIEKGAQLSKANDKRETPMDLIFEHVQNPGDFLVSLFEKNVLRQGGRNIDLKDASNEEKDSEEDNRKRFCFDYRILNPRSGGGAGEVKDSNLVLSNLLINMKKNPDEGEQLLVHPLVESFIVMKWRKVKRWFLAQIFITFFFVLAYSMFASIKCLRNGSDPSTVAVFMTVLAPLLLEIILFEVFLFYGQGVRYHYKQSIIGFTAILTSLVNMCAFTECSGFYRDVSAISTLLVWIYFFTVISINPHIGTETLIFIKVGKRLTKLMMAYSSIIFGFTLAFALVLPDKANFNHMFIRVNTIMSMLMGEVSMDVLPTSLPNATNPYNSLFWTQWNSIDYTAHIIFFTFCFTVSIVVFNILTAFAIKDVEEVLKDAEMNKLMKQADYISLLEQSYFSRYIDLNIEPVVTVRPGLSADLRNNFDKKLVGKWQKVLYD
eukprot:GFUD01008075.1.p1 GENE.GFUD01008075.1~~GFUD01008075.1.p1  ORF type:complete len:850 (+),score=222.46 GFUD01008075.1:59-2608(+)